MRAFEICIWSFRAPTWPFAAISKLLAYRALCRSPVRSAPPVTTRPVDSRAEATSSFGQYVIPDQIVLADLPTESAAHVDKAPASAASSLRPDPPADHPSFARATLPTARPPPAARRQQPARPQQPARRPPPAGTAAPGPAAPRSRSPRFRTPAPQRPRLSGPQSSDRAGVRVNTAQDGSR